MASQREIARIKTVALAAFVWARVAVDFTTLKVDVTPVTPQVPDPYGCFIPLYVPYPTIGEPIYFGTTEGDTEEDPGYKDQVFRNGITLVPDKRTFIEQNCTVKFITSWSGDPRVEDILSDPGPVSDSDRSAGGSPNPNESNLLIIYINKVKKFYTYSSDEKVVIKYRLYWKVSYTPIKRKSNGLPEKFEVVVTPLEGKNELTGKCFPARMKLFHEWYTDIMGNPVNRNGEPLSTYTRNNDPMMISVMM